MPVYVLRLDADGVWRGLMLQSPGMPVELSSPAPIEAATNTMTENLLAVLDGVLDMAAAQPNDNELARDVLGAVRLLSAIDPVVAQRLMRDDDDATSSTRTRLLRSVRAALTANVEIAPGRNWLHPGEVLNSAGYERR